MSAIPPSPLTSTRSRPGSPPVRLLSGRKELRAAGSADREYLDRHAGTQRCGTRVQGNDAAGNGWPTDTWRHTPDRHRRRDPDRRYLPVGTNGALRRPAADDQLVAQPVCSGPFPRGQTRPPRPTSNSRNCCRSDTSRKPPTRTDLRNRGNIRDIQMRADACGVENMWRLRDDSPWMLD